MIDTEALIIFPVSSFENSGCLLTIGELAPMISNLLAAKVFSSGIFFTSGFVKISPCLIKLLSGFKILGTGGEAFAN
jgi:hypothetical protein